MFSSLAGKTILVTGGTGFVGKRLLQRLQAVPNISILALSRQHMTATSLNLQWLQCDMQKLTKEFWRIHDIKNIDIVCHLGAFIPKSTDEINNVDLAFENNLNGMRHLFDSLPSAPQHVLFTSSVDVYAKSSNSIIDENFPVEPSNLYAASKLFGEQLVKVYAAMWKSTYSILRLGHTYGVGEFAYHKFIPEVIRKVLANQPPIVYGDGSVLRDFLYIDDAIEALLRALTRSPLTSMLINVVSGKSVSLKEIIEKIIAVSSKDIKPQYDFEKPNGVSLVFNNQSMVEALGTWDLVSLTKGLENEYRDFCAQAV